MKTRKQPTLKSVVVGTDFSTAADPALSWAMSIARTHGAVLHVVHAVTRTLPFVRSLDPTSVMGEISTGLGQQRLSQLADTLRSPDQPLECHLVHDRASVAILKIAQLTRAGLLVLGTRGEGGLRNLLLGSTAERAAQRSSVPVLMVPPESTNAERWPSRILVGTDFSLEADAAICGVESIFRLHEKRAEVSLLTVFHPPEQLEQFEDARVVWRSYVTECKKLLAERMESLNASVDSTGLSTQMLIREGIPAVEIVRASIEEEIDLIAVGSRGTFAAGRAFLGSVSKRVVQTATCPTLIVPSLLSRRMRVEARS